MATGTQNSDAAVAERFLAADTAEAAGGKDTVADDSNAAGTREWYGDSAYGTGDLRGVIDDAGHGRESHLGPQGNQVAAVMASTTLAKGSLRGAADPKADRGCGPSPRMLMIRAGSVRVGSSAAAADRRAPVPVPTDHD